MNRRVIIIPLRDIVDKFAHGAKIREIHGKQIANINLPTDELWIEVEWPDKKKGKSLKKSKNV